MRGPGLACHRERDGEVLLELRLGISLTLAENLTEGTSPSLQNFQKRWANLPAAQEA